MQIKTAIFPTHTSQGLEFKQETKLKICTNDVEQQELSSVAGGKNRMDTATLDGSLAVSYKNQTSTYHLL